ncbi:hypothetical protein BGW36DRAFT_319844 [Talaromyces proteolyticus]|uniref:Uncharacterized protein n=1 Tax=Talaromyces proteolyticus TaxID=1131652 RepID=A0AAD4KPH0_9EURO|nr:uncharacterized protein BGW36DRAFT_319844 [Talaromyces proteolyticus]KAH8697448.1 hypothetical protein BGW36DRAFT_319844 [Talaromyces proteolyticus]
MAASRPFSSFRLLSFDVYGTLINWEKGIFKAFSPISERLPASSPLKNDKFALGAAFHEHEKRIQSLNPGLTYDKVLKEAYIALARELNTLPTDAEEDKEAALQKEGTVFADSIAIWPAFPDTVEALRKLKSLGFKLVPLSNVDRDSFSRSLDGPLAGLKAPVPGSNTLVNPFFDAVYTAQDIGSYKPNLKNFEYLINHVETEFGVKKEDILHVAQSQFHDHVPAKRIGLQSVWIARGEGGVTSMGGDAKHLLEKGEVGFGWSFKSLGDFAAAVEAERVYTMSDKFHKALAAIDAAHYQDPNLTTKNDDSTNKQVPYELHYAEKMTSYLESYNPSASELLRLAIRAQHLRRWEIPRSSYPATKVGYFSWRTFLKNRQAELAQQYCLEAGYSAEESERVAALVRKENLKKDEDTQTLEDVACLVFLDDQFDAFEKEMDDEEKMVGILRKTWGKMSDKGRGMALQITMSERCRELVGKALKS